VNKIHTGQMSLTLSSFRVDELIGNALEQVHYERHGKKIRLQGKTALTIEADKVRLEQVLVNLLTNAIKYSPKADEVTIRVQIIDSSLKISVKDNGIGIPSDKIPHLFGRYYRVENSSQSFSGLGMGLYISSEIVKLHNGRIGVSSELGEGSEFWFSIPINQ
jgi:signal transduction histidine kinase